jgi:hypothetical protein
MNDGFVILMHNRACSRGSRSSSGSRAALEITLPRALIGASRAHALVLSDVLRYHVHTHRTERCVWTKERKRMSSEAKHSEEELGVVITGGAGSIAYALIPLIGNGTVLHPVCSVRDAPYTSFFDALLRFALAYASACCACARRSIARSKCIRRTEFFIHFCANFA